MQPAAVALLTASARIPMSAEPHPLPDLVQRSNSVISNVACTRDDVSICGIAFRVTGQKTLGQFLQVLLGIPLKMILIVLVSWLIRRVLHRLIDRLVERISRSQPHHASIAERWHERHADRTEDTDGSVTGSESVGYASDSATDEELPGSRRLDPELAAHRREARARTVGSVLRSVTTGAVGVVALLMVLEELTIPITPLLASAGVLGVAIGFGAQSLVRDVVAGIFMIVEDQYGVGDDIDVGPATGTVEAIGLRVTRLRDVTGTVWYVRNGEILRVGNHSQGWSRVVLQVPVAYGEDLDQVHQVLREVIDGFLADPRLAELALEPPEIWGVEQLTSEAVMIKLAVRTLPTRQDEAARALRLRIKTALEAAGISMAAQPWAIREPVAGPDDGTEQPVSAPQGANAMAGSTSGSAVGSTAGDAPAGGRPAGQPDSEGRHRSAGTDPFGS